MSQTDHQDHYALNETRLPQSDRPSGWTPNRKSPLLDKIEWGPLLNKRGCEFAQLLQSIPDSRLERASAAADGYLDPRNYPAEFLTRNVYANLIERRY